jgi:hypothetical protein
MRTRSLQTILREYRHHVLASARHRVAGREHAENRVFHAEQAHAEELLALAVQKVCTARPAQISRWLRSSDPAVRAFVIEHMGRQ